MNPFSLFFHLLLFYTPFCFSQVKFVVEDFEGFANGIQDMKINGVFSYGNISTSIKQFTNVGSNFTGDRYLQICKAGNQNYGGWGKGLGHYIELESSTDFLQFFARTGRGNSSALVQVIIQEDDNQNNSFDSLRDDYWVKNISICSDNWFSYALPLDSFKDGNKGGDSRFNANYREGKIFSVLFRCFPDKKVDFQFDVDDIIFSRGQIYSGFMDSISMGIKKTSGFCNLGAWSKSNSSNFFDNVDGDFNSMFNNYPSRKNLGVVHFFHPFTLNTSESDKFFPDRNKINEVIHRGYLPMITLENHFSNRKNISYQPGLQAIINGDFDDFFKQWAHDIQQLDGMVFLRILHEFNGDWYSWSTATNRHNQKMLIYAFRHIHSIFKKSGVRNVKFVWCPNSMSLPQESWNNMVDAYPGDEFVDFIGVDVYNGAGEGSVWRSFRKEFTEAYFLITSNFPSKPIFICETACRERLPGECKTNCQSKAEWIRQMSVALQNDFPSVVMLVWFNESVTFRIDSSSESLSAFVRFVFQQDWFKSGLSFVYPLIRP